MKTDPVSSVAQTGTPRQTRAHTPGNCPQLGDRVENPAHWCQEVPGSPAREAGNTQLA